MYKATLITYGPRGRQREKECGTGPFRVGQGRAGNGPALRLALTFTKDKSEHVLLVDDEDTLRGIINQCEAVLSARDRINRAARLPTPDLE